MNDIVIQFADMMRHGAEIKRLALQEAKYAKMREDYADRLRGLLGHMSRDEVRALWDAFDDETSFCAGFDCADVHGYLNLIGDGQYCAV